MTQNRARTGTNKKDEKEFDGLVAVKYEYLKVCICIRIHSLFFVNASSSLVYTGKDRRLFRLIIHCAVRAIIWHKRQVHVSQQEQPKVHCCGNLQQCSGHVNKYTQTIVLDTSILYTYI